MKNRIALKQYMRKVFLWLFLVYIFSGCTPLKRLIYFQNDDYSIQEVDTIFLPKNRNDYKIKPGDYFYIKIIGLDEETYNLMNAERSNNPNSMTQEEGVYFNSYVVDDSGHIELPLIGKINVASKNISKVESIIKQSVKEYLTSATVIVKLASFKISILGEVSSPGHYPIYDKEINLIEALSMAGDLTHEGNRESVKVMRVNDQGELIVKKLDITKEDFILSDFFYLQPDDIIYVEPLRAKQFATNPFRIDMNIILSSITTILLIINFLQ